MPKKRKIKITETKLGRRKALGLWEHNNANSSSITIDERLKGFQRLLIIIHESVHEVCPDWTEEKVVETSEILAGIIWKCDYRHVDHAGEDKPNYSTFAAVPKSKTVTTPYVSAKKRVKVRNTTTNA